MYYDHFSGDRVTLLNNNVELYHNSWIASGVYVSRHADIIRPYPLDPGCQGYLVLFKVMKVSNI
jgi:hypothetical protein